MKFNLIVCTYCRSDSLLRLLKSVREQTPYPNEIIIVDGSEDDETGKMLREHSFDHLQYYKVGDKDRGLTRQRNFGIEKTGNDIEYCCFLDDDIVLEPGYFEHLLYTFRKYPDAIGVGGAIIKEGVWKKSKLEQERDFKKYYYGVWERKLGSRNVLRKRLGLLSDKPPGVMPVFSNGFSVGFYPPTGEIHPVDYFMGGVSAYKKELFDSIKFSEYFEGYGLYEDMDFCLRASRLGNLYLNTAANCYHLHEESGRPNYFKYGKMVVENGWVVWKLKYPHPAPGAILKWNSIVLLLACIRIKNGLVGEKGALKEAAGRFSSWVQLAFKKPDYFNPER